MLAGCGEAKHRSSSSSNGSQHSASGPGFQAFKAGFYQFAIDKDCVKCHGSIVSPKFASADLSEAYSAAFPLVNFNNPNSSSIVSYSGNGHCNDTPCSNPANPAEVQGLLATWAAGELAGGQGGNPNPGGGGPAVTPKYLTATLTLPATIANYDAAANASTPLRFPLNAFVPQNGAPALPAKFNTAILEVEVRYTGTSQTHYRFNRMKIYATNQAGQTATIQGMHLYIKSAGDPGNPIEDLQQTLQWNNIGKPTLRVAPIQARPANLPATPVNVTVFGAANETIIYPKIGPGDVVVIGFEELQ